MKTSEDSALRTERMKNMWANPENRARRVQSMKQAYTDPVKRKRLEIGLAKGRQSAFQDIAGQQFGNLKVLRKHSRRTNRKTVRILWEVACVCGKVLVVMGCNLHSGHTRSCGCMGKRAGNKGVVRFAQRCSIYRSGAKKRGLTWALTNDQVLQIVILPCFFCGALPSMATSLGSDTATIFTHGIDRLENTEGYELGNCVPCCFSCNRMKGTLSFKSFLTNAKAIADRWSGRKGTLQLHFGWDGSLSSSIAEHVEV